MSALATADQPSIVASVAGCVLPVPFPDVTSEVLLHLDVCDFGFHLAAPVTDFQFERESGRVTLRSKIDDLVVFTLILSGRLTDAFHIDEVSIQSHLLVNKPRGVFVESTLFALLGLSLRTDLRVPLIDLDLRQRFDLSLKRKSQRLQMRQLAFRLMVIERATGLEFLLPDEDYSATDVKTISHLHHAIVDRSFMWPIGRMIIRVPANDEGLSMLPMDETPASQELGPTRRVIDLFGHSIYLGDETLFIQDAVFDNLASVRRELAMNDGHLVETTVRSLTGTGRVTLDNAPRLPEAPWDANTQALIDLEPHLGTCLADRYNELAASTLADLTEEEKREATTRPELDEEALAMDRPYEEND
ncbi:MAG TPA: hypothetical protein VFV34_01310 [Blastocatellia bacterium]|nr:hypothetical protein [Blastocatellia bacterium]